MPTGGRGSSASGCASTTRTSSGCRPASSGSTTSTAPTGPTTAAGRRPRPRCVARWPWPSRTGGSGGGGGGEQTRSFFYVDDCVEGIYRLMQSDYPEPLNLGTEEMVTINQLARLV